MRLSRTRGAEDAAPVLTLLTDYGSGDLYVGLLHAVIARICPGARVIDLSHQVPGGDILGGALALRDALAYLPLGIHVAIVDPGVGTDRRALALRCEDGRVLIGPDNGLLTLAADACGGVQSAVDLADSPLALDPVSATFHGRDIFAPVAAALAAGHSFVTAGALIEADDLVTLELPGPEFRLGYVEVTVTAVDYYGNLSLLALPSDAAKAELELGAAVAIRVGDRRLYGRYGRTFAEVGHGRLLIFEDSNGRLGLAQNGGSAALLLGVGVGSKLRLSL